MCAQYDNNQTNIETFNWWILINADTLVLLFTYKSKYKIAGQQTMFFVKNLTSLDIKTPKILYCLPKT